MTLLYVMFENALISCMTLLYLNIKIHPRYNNVVKICK